MTHLCRLTEMEILYKKEKEEADQLLEQQRLVSLTKLESIGIHFELMGNVVIVIVLGEEISLMG